MNSQQSKCSSMISIPEEHDDEDENEQYPPRQQQQQQQAVSPADPSERDESSWKTRKQQGHSYKCRAIFIAVLLVCAIFVGGSLFLTKPAESFRSLSKNQRKAATLFNVNGPPVPLPGGKTLNSITPKRRGGGSARAVVEDRHAKKSWEKEFTLSAASSSLGTTPIHAAEVLVCQSSIVNYVINATDAKDECDGLTKAFHKACGGDEERRRTRRLKKSDTMLSIRNRWSVFFYQIQQWWQQKVFRRFTTSPFHRTFFFAEDAVVAAYEDARYLVQNDMDMDVYYDLRRSIFRRRRLVEETSKSSNATKTAMKQPKLLDLPKVSGGGSQSRANVAALDIMSGGSANEDDEKTKQHNFNEDDYTTLDPNSPEARLCCVSILNVYQENCSIVPEEDVSDQRLFFVVCVMAFCGMVKSLIRHFRILWLPEAAGCILVGVLSGYFLMLFPHHDISFDGNWFLRILVPPIVFEAALSIDKRSFNRHLIPILLYAVAGTLMATWLTAVVVHRGSVMLSRLCTPIPFVEALTFGALISSIDPIAVLSVLSNMGMTDTDTIYVVIFGESLLNDGVAIVLFHTLVHFLDENLVIDREALSGASVHFFVVAFGSLLIGVACGIVGTVYYWLFYQCQTPLVEVLMFFCWALTPYYICDGVGWSGIVAAVATGFVMDLHIVGQKEGSAQLNHESESSVMETTIKTNRRARRPIFAPHGHLSEEAKTHIGFVAELIAATMETAIFAYLGLFLFSHRYHWNIVHTFLAILACCVSRGLMIPSLSFVANSVGRAQNLRASWQQRADGGWGQSASVFIDRRMQLALWFAGLRGAMSFALVEHIPLFDAETQEGTRVKPELKAMTSASILFTVFVLGGSTFYMMEHLGMAPSHHQSTASRKTSMQEMVSLVNNKAHESEDEEFSTDTDAATASIMKADPRVTGSKPGRTFRARHFAKSLIGGGH